MLDTRYVHLHEALGLGAMWLKNSAKIINALPEKNPPKKLNKNNEARQKLLAQFAKTAPEKTQEIAPTKTPEKTQKIPLSWLSGSLKPAKVLVLSLFPSTADIAAQKLFSGEDGMMLSRMFKAIELPENQAYLTCWFKHLPDFNPNPSQDELLAALPSVLADLAGTQAQAILLLGKVFYDENVLAQIRQATENTAVFVIPHPLRILADTSLKREAWETLQKLQKYLAQSA